MKQHQLPRWAGLAAVLLGICCMVVGICRGEMAVVLEKATRICLECIGIG